MSERESFKMNDVDFGSDQLEAVADGNAVTLTVEEPWAADTETGFGRECSIRFSYEAAREFAEWLLAVTRHESR